MSTSQNINIGVLPNLGILWYFSQVERTIRMGKGRNNGSIAFSTRLIYIKVATSLEYFTLAKSHDAKTIKSLNPSQNPKNEKKRRSTTST